MKSIRLFALAGLSVLTHCLEQDYYSPLQIHGQIMSLTTVGHYTIVEMLGSGGMGDVYRARDTKLGRDVAIKMLAEKFALNREYLSRFTREARAASALNHPSIVTIYEIGTHELGPYIAMEYIDGKPLRDVLQKGPLPIYEVLRIATQVASGLAQAHEAGIIHRDLKPSNLMLVKDGRVKILDFGLAKLTENYPDEERSSDSTTDMVATRTGIVMGTPPYMSPEQAAGKQVDFTTDQFSFGTILYEMATGKQPFDRDTPVQTMASIITEEPEPILRLNPQLPPALHLVIERCHVKNPKHRYPLTRRLAKDLEGLQFGLMLDQLRPPRN
jgi:serine/threonine protein kinase